MLLSTESGTLACKFGTEEAIRILARQGFDAYDMSLFLLGSEKDPEFNVPDWRGAALHLREVADDCSIICNQAHAPFPSSTGDAEKDLAIFGDIVRSMEIASILGAKIIVVHPKQHLSWMEHAEEIMEMNVEFYKSLIPYCKKFNIKVAVENMWQHIGCTRIIGASACSRAEEFCEYIDRIGSEWIVACLDIGHTLLSGESVTRAIKMLGHDRLKALHVHDNDLVNDLHTLPFTRSFNFREVTKALAEIDYDGDFTFEADSFLGGFPTEMWEDVSHFMQITGRCLIKMIESNK